MAGAGRPLAIIRFGLWVLNTSTTQSSVRPSFKLLEEFLGPSMKFDGRREHHGGCIVAPLSRGSLCLCSHSEASGLARLFVCLLVRSFDCVLVWLFC